MTTIAQERAALNGQRLTRRLREQWAARFDYTDARPVDEPATRLFLHRTVTNPANYSSNDAHARAVEAIGISRFPATGISYNALVLPHGQLYEAQPIGRRGAHTVNDFQRATCAPHGNPITAPSWNLNVNARAIAIASNCGDPVTPADIDAAARCAAAWKRAGFVARSARWCGHRCCAAKSCPCDNAFALIPQLAQLTEHYTINGLDDDMPWDAGQQADINTIKGDLDNIQYVIGERITANIMSAGFHDLRQAWRADIQELVKDEQILAAVAAVVVNVDADAVAQALLDAGISGITAAEVQATMEQVLNTTKLTPVVST